LGEVGVNETRTIFDPFLGKNVEISDNLTDRLRGKYANGPMLPSGEPEFGWRQFPTVPIQIDAANEIDRLRAEVTFYRDQVVEAANLLKPFAAVADCGDHFDHDDTKHICSRRISGTRIPGPTIGECRAARQFARARAHEPEVLP
jgi:hypothetical protein